MLREIQSGFGTLWCGLMHESLMWPAHGEYQCRACGRRYPAFAETREARRVKSAAFKPAAPLILALAAAMFAGSARATDAIKGHVPADAEAVFEKYVARGSSAQWAAESVEIHAGLPKLSKTGQLRAIRRQVPDGEAKYQVLEVVGDRTVRDQLITRYLNAEERAEYPAAAIAITPANYKFSYHGEISDGERQAFAFQITPRKKRAGLIEGEIWLDEKTGALVRESGRLVKSPSMWIRRVVITQENSLRDGVVEARLTHILADTRLAGRAELVIEERPLSAAERAQFSTLIGEGGQQ
jgi:hypothetical protein